MTSSLSPAHLTCEYFVNPIGLDAQHPRLSWKLNAAARNARQNGYQIVVTDAGDGGDLIWDSGQVASEQSVQVAYGGPALRSGQRCYWRVRVWDGDDQPSDWSESAFWEMGLLNNAEWQADWITPDVENDAAPLLRTGFALEGEIKSARIYATSLGLYELHVNGQRVGDGLLTPGWTSYKHRLQYQAYDVTTLLQTGDNAIGAMLADGWYRGYLGFNGKRALYGKQLALLLQLHVAFADGRTVVITSNDQWKSSTGPITRADLYNGESYDARLEQAGWAAPGFDEGAWQSVRVLDQTKQNIVAQIGPFVRRQERLKPVQIIKSPKGETIFDFGQNMVGWVQLNITCQAGTKITLRHAEVLDQHGNFYTDNLRKAQQLVEYTAKGGEEIYEPRFTFMGFQFVQVDGFPGEPTLDSLSGIVVHSEMPSIGTFECSNPMINQLQHNIVWGQKGNFVDVPTDCPQRDERLGWTGDAQVFMRTACFNRDVAAFFGKWLRDLAADQHPTGSVPFVSPDLAMMPGMNSAGATGWGDAAIICPWTIYLSYGDTRILETQYDSMTAWINFMREQTGERYIWAKGFHFGDWLDFRGNSPLIPSPVTNVELIATAFFSYSTQLMQQIATVLGKHEDAASYAQLAAHIKKAFNAEFVAPNGRVGPNSQTAYVLALHFDLLPEKLRPLAAARLAEEVRKADYHLTTGFLGTPYVCQVLSRFGYTDLAYELLNQESFPSWLYPVKKGATTIWERWDGIKPDGSFQDVGMNSFNHYSYGAIGEWMYRVVAGIEADPNQGGYKHFFVQPQPGGGLTHARASLQSPYGEVASAWQLSARDLRLQVTVPPNTRATVRLPGRLLSQVKEGGKALKAANSVLNATAKGGVVTLELGSGQYEFVTTGTNLAQANANVRHVAGRLDRGVSLRELLGNEAAKAILVKQLGEEALQGFQSPFVINNSLGAIARVAPQVFTEERLKEIEGEFMTL